MTLPIFLVFVFGIIEFGRALMVQQALTTAAREGVRLASLPSTTDAEVQQTVLNTLESLGVSPNTAAVSLTPSPLTSVTAGQMVTVTVQLPFTSVSYLPLPYYLGNVQLSGVCTMRSETL